MWLAATRARTAPGSTVSRRMSSPVATTASARDVGMPSACIASPMTYSRSIGPTAALPSPPRAKGVRPEPFRCRSRRSPWTSTISPSSSARPSPSRGEYAPNWCPAYAWATGVAPSGTVLPASTSTPASERRAAGSAPSSAASSSLSASSRGAATGAPCHGTYRPSSSRTKESSKANRGRAATLMPSRLVRDVHPGASMSDQALIRTTGAFAGTSLTRSTSRPPMSENPPTSTRTSGPTTTFAPPMSDTFVMVEPSGGTSAWVRSRSRPPISVTSVVRRAARVAPRGAGRPSA